MRFQHLSMLAARSLSSQSVSQKNRRNLAVEATLQRGCFRAKASGVSANFHCNLKNSFSIRFVTRCESIPELLALSITSDANHQEQSSPSLDPSIDNVRNRRTESKKPAHMHLNS
jgi:hypothetical protein